MEASVGRSHNLFLAWPITSLQCFCRCPLLYTHKRLFRRPSAAYNSVNPGSFSKWKPAKDDDERVSKFQLQRHSQKKISLHFFVTDFRHSYKLCTSQQRQPSTHTHGWVYYGRSRLGLRPGRTVPGIKNRRWAVYLNVKTLHLIQVTGECWKRDVAAVVWVQGVGPAAEKLVLLNL